MLEPVFCEGEYLQEWADRAVHAEKQAQRKALKLHQEVYEKRSPRARKGLRGATSVVGLPVLVRPAQSTTGLPARHVGADRVAAGAGAGAGATAAGEIADNGLRGAKRRRTRRKHEQEEELHRGRSL